MKARTHSGSLVRGVGSGYGATGARAAYRPLHFDRLSVAGRGLSELPARSESIDHRALRQHRKAVFRRAVAENAYGNGGAAFKPAVGCRGEVSSPEKYGADCAGGAERGAGSRRPMRFLSPTTATRW
jgi:hypothetical protein